MPCDRNHFYGGSGCGRKHPGAGNNRLIIACGTRRGSEQGPSSGMSVHLHFFGYVGDLLSELRSERAFSVQVVSHGPLEGNHPMGELVP